MIRSCSVPKPRLRVILLTGALVIVPIVADGAEQGKSDYYIGLYILGSAPKDKNLGVRTGVLPFTSVGGGGGLGVKAGIYPLMTKRFLGVEAEIFGHGGDVKAPLTAGGLFPRFANANLAVVNQMFNLLVRYPGAVIQPYAGVGGGISTGVMTKATIWDGLVIVFGSEADTTLGYQFLGGLRVNISKRFFAFGEYR